MFQKMIDGNNKLGVSVLVILGMIVFFLFVSAKVYRIEEGNAGVKVSWSGKVDHKELKNGIHIVFFSQVYEFTTKEMSVTLSDLAPKSRDNLSFEKLDLEVYYRVQEEKLSEMHTKYFNRHREIQTNILGNVYFSSYDLLYSYARSITYQVVSDYDSLSAHLHRSKIATEIKQRLQAELDQNDMGVFLVTKVIIRNLVTDKSIEDSIRIAIEEKKKLERKEIELKVSELQVKINKNITKYLTDAILKKQYYETIEKTCKTNNCTFILGSDKVTPLLNIK